MELFVDVANMRVNPPCRPSKPQSNTWHRNGVRQKFRAGSVWNGKDALVTSNLKGSLSISFIRASGNALDIGRRQENRAP